MVTNTKTVIMNLLKTNFETSTLWDDVELELTKRCSELPNPTTKINKIELIGRLQSIINYLSEKEIKIEDLKFLQDEIERYENTKTISLYLEEEDNLPRGVIEKYASSGEQTEGIIGIHHKYNYEQIKQLTNGVFKATGLVKFFISKEKTINGKIIAEVYEYAQDVPIANIIESKKINKETDEPEFKKIELFGNLENSGAVRLIKEISMPFYIYRFLSHQNREYMLMSNEQLVVGDYKVEGMEVITTDRKMLTDSAKIKTKLPFLFINTIKNRIVKYKSHKEFFTAVNSFGITKKNFFNYPFSSKFGDKTLRMLHPEWYQWLIWSWNIHQSKGLNNYPMHLMIIGPKGTGKSNLLNSLHNKSKENKDIFSGSSSTIKSLVPSFKHTPAKVGYFAESNRFSYCDEFLRCLTGIRNGSDANVRDESVAMMNDLLEHQKREAGSGVSRVRANMTSRVIATTNPIRGINNVQNLLEKLDESFCSRWLIYYQTQNHVNMITNSKDHLLKSYDFKLSDDDWVGIVDYLQSFSAEYDLERLDKIYEEVIPMLTETLRNHYTARHFHHIECLLDGIIKTRCFLNRDWEFKAIDEDYEMLKNVWAHLIQSWLDSKMVGRIPLSSRINYMPEDAQYIYNLIEKAGGRADIIEIKGKCKEEMHSTHFLTEWNNLLQQGLIEQDDEEVKLYWFKEQEGLL